MRNVDVVVFDKTGTLTEGHPTVIGWLWAQGQEDHYKDVLLAAESTSDHPLAEAIVTALKGKSRLSLPIWTVSKALPEKVSEWPIKVRNIG